MKLNLGCGVFPLEGYRNVDIRKEVNPDMCFDLTAPPYPIGPGTVEEIHTDHVMEHLTQWKYGDIFAEFMRVLRPGGTLIIKVPDMKHFMKQFMNYLAEMAYVQEETRRDEMALEFWGKESVVPNGGHRHAFDYHISSFDFAYYRALLRRAGFVNITEGYNDRGLVITARKP